MKRLRGSGGHILTHLIIVSLLLSALLLNPGAANAHRPWFNLNGSQNPEEPYVLEDVAVSQVVYGGFSETGRIDFYRLTVPIGFAADIQIVVPDVAKCDVFRPIILIAGPGINSSEALPAGIELPAEWSSKPETGWTIVESEEWGLFFEPFTRSTYATSPRFLESLDGGDYLIAIVEPDGDPGTDGLALGGSERPGGDPDFFDLIVPIDECNPPLVSPLPFASPEP